MRRVAILAPRSALRAALVAVAEAGCVQIELADAAGGPAADRLRRLRASPGRAVVSAEPPDVDALERAGRADLLAGEAELEERAASAVLADSGPDAVAALAGWCPADRVADTAERLAGAGGTLLPLPPPRGVDPPTQLSAAGPARRSFGPLIRTYGTVPYADMDPTLPAGVIYVVMFGVMFGDAGHGLLLVLAALLLRRGLPRRAAALRPLWPLVAGAGLTSALAGAAYGEFFGPTGVLPVLWLDPLDEPTRPLTAALALGAVLLLFAYAAGVANRRRESGWAGALYAPTGVAGITLFLGLGLAAIGVWLGRPGVALAGAFLASVALLLAGAGAYSATAGGAAAVFATGVGLFDLVIRTASNAVSFVRLAAFGLTHAALGDIVWDGTTALAGRGGAALPAAVLVFAVGNALAFALEALVAGAQALRLEFYELFSRVFVTQGRPFRPWHPPVERVEVAP
jgi:V/A-type H+-transporting ATPase subunit I